MKSRQETVILVKYDKLDDLRSSIDNRYHYFYKIVNLINNKYYYGIHTTDDIYDGYVGSGTILKYVYKKYGKENCIKYILEFFDDRKSLLDYEKSIINQELLDDSNCYNIIIGGCGSYNTVTPVITIDGISKVVSKEEYKNNKHLYRHPTSGKIHINNGLKNKLIFPKDLDEYLKMGWVLGETNKSTIGKIVINKDGEIDRFIYEDELKKYIENGWTRGGKSRNKGQKSFAKGQIWINKDGVQKRVNLNDMDSYLKDGWVEGTCQTSLKGYIRITNGETIKNIKPENIEELNYYLNNGWWKGSLSINKGNIWVKKADKMVSIPKDKYDEYLKNGWVRGRLLINYFNTNEGKIFVNNGVDIKLISKDELNEYLKNGWVRGNYKVGGTHNLDKIRVNKNGNIKNINKDELDKYLKDGWEKGMGKSIMKGRIRINNGVCEKLVTLEEFETTYSKDGWIRGLLNKRK